MGTEQKCEGREGVICEMQRLYLMCVVAAMLLRIATPGPLDAAAWLLYSFPLSSATQYLLRPPLHLFFFFFLHSSSPLPRRYVSFCVSLQFFIFCHRLLQQTRQSECNCFVLNQCVSYSLGQNSVVFTPQYFVVFDPSSSSSSSSYYYYYYLLCSLNITVTIK